jgi:hypothetical protein
VAAAAFTALANALAVSLWALLPHINLGYPSGFAALFCVSATIRTHVGREGRRDTSTTMFVLAILVYAYQFLNAIVLVARPHDTAYIYSAAYTVFAAFATGLSRSWQLMQPERPGTKTAVPSDALDPAALDSAALNSAAEA